MALTIEDVIEALSREGQTAGGALPVPRGGRGRPPKQVKEMRRIVDEALERSRFQPTNAGLPTVAQPMGVAQRIVSSPPSLTGQTSKVATDIVKGAPRDVSRRVLQGTVQGSGVKRAVSGLDDVVDAVFKTAPKKAASTVAKALPAPVASALGTKATQEIGKKVAGEVAKKGLLRAGLGRLGGLFGGPLGIALGVGLPLAMSFFGDDDEQAQAQTQVRPPVAQPSGPSELDRALIALASTGQALGKEALGSRQAVRNTGRDIADILAGAQF